MNSRIHLLIVLALAAGCAASEPRPKGTPSLTTDQNREAVSSESFTRAVQEAADRLLREPGPFVMLADVRTVPGGVRYRLGGVMPDALGNNEDAFTLAACTQAHATTLANAFKKSELPKDVWSETVQNLSDIVRDLSRDTNNPRQDALRPYRFRSEQALSELVAKLESHARTQKLTLERDKNDLTVANAFTAKGIHVTTKTIPEGGTIRMLKALTYAKETRLLGKSEGDVSWMTVLSPKGTFMGEYRYWVTWPGGRQARGFVDVQADTQVIEFRPDN